MVYIYLHQAENISLISSYKSTTFLSWQENLFILIKRIFFDLLGTRNFNFHNSDYIYRFNNSIYTRITTPLNNYKKSKKL